MILEGEHLFKGPRQEVWEMFRDPEALSACLPGKSKLTKIDEQHFDGAINIRVGPVSGNFAGGLEVTDEIPPEKCTLVISGRGAAGFVKGIGRIQFVDQGDGITLLQYTGEANIGGTLASVGQRMVDSVAKTMFKAAFDSLDRSLEARLAAKVSGSD